MYSKSAQRYNEGVEDGRGVEWRGEWEEDLGPVRKKHDEERALRPEGRAPLKERARDGLAPDARLLADQLLFRYLGCALCPAPSSCLEDPLPATLNIFHHIDELQHTQAL